MGLFPLLNGREPPFEAALDFLQFSYTANRAGAYVAPASKVLFLSVVAEGNEFFAALLAHLRRQYPKVYGFGPVPAWAPERGETPIGAGEGLSGGNSIINSSLNLGAYSGRLDNLNLAGINNPIPNLTTVYLDTLLVGPTPEPLEYVPSLGRLGQPSRYTPSSTRTSVRGACRRPPPPPPLTTPTHTCFCQLVGRNRARGPVKIKNFSPTGGTPSEMFVRGVGEA